MSVTILVFALHIALILLTLASLQPFDRGIQLLAYTAAVKVSIVVHVFRLSRRHPLPGQLSLASFRSWASAASSTTETFYIFASFLLLSNHAGSLMLTSQSVLAGFHALSYGRSLNIGPFRRLCTKLATQQHRALLIMGLCDIGAAVQLFLAAIGGGAGVRGLIQSFVYLNLLRQRSASKSPECSYYSTAWKFLGQSAFGMAISRLPFFDVVARWFQS